MVVMRNTTANTIRAITAMNWNDDENIFLLFQADRLCSIRPAAGGKPHVTSFFNAQMNERGGAMAAQASACDFGSRSYRLKPVPPSHVPRVLDEAHHTTLSALPTRAHKRCHAHSGSQQLPFQPGWRCLLRCESARQPACPAAQKSFRLSRARVPGSKPYPKRRSSGN